jgi:hypothetical protein
VDECVLCESELGPDGGPYCDECFSILVKFRANTFDGTGSYADFLHRISRRHLQ